MYSTYILSSFPSSEEQTILCGTSNPTRMLEDESRTVWNCEGARVENARAEGARSDDRRRWQDEISSGFDRLVALASEVDRRKYGVSDADKGGYSRCAAHFYHLSYHLTICLTRNFFF